MPKSPLLLECFIFKEDGGAIQVEVGGVKPGTGHFLAWRRSYRGQTAGLEESSRQRLFVWEHRGLLNPSQPLPGFSQPLKRRVPLARVRFAAGRLHWRGCSMWSKGDICQTELEASRALLSSFIDSQLRCVLISDKQQTTAINTGATAGNYPQVI